MSEYIRGRQTKGKWVSKTIGITQHISSLANGKTAKARQTLSWHRNNKAGASVSNHASSVLPQLLLAAFLRKTALLSCCMGKDICCLWPRSPWTTSGWKSCCFAYAIEDSAGGFISIKLLIGLNYLYDWPLELLSVLFSSPGFSKSLHPARSLCEANTMQTVQTPQKGIALESHTSAVWPLAALGNLAESLQTPSRLQLGGTEQILTRGIGGASQQMTPHCFLYLYFWMLGVGGWGANFCKLHSSRNSEWLDVSVVTQSMEETVSAILSIY